MKLELARNEYIAYVQDQQRKEVLRKQEREEKLKEKYAKYRDAIEEYVDKMIRDNYSSSFISVDLLPLAQTINCEDLITKSGGEVVLSHYQIGEYVALLYQENGFGVKINQQYKDEYNQTYGSNSVTISGWR